MDSVSTGPNFSSRRSAGGHTAEHLPKEMNEMRIKEDRAIAATAETANEDKVSFWHLFSSSVYHCFLLHFIAFGTEISCYYVYCFNVKFLRSLWGKFTVIPLKANWTRVMLSF